MKKFSTNPECLGEYESYTEKIDCDGKEVLYQDTNFSKMDNYLINQIHRKFTDKK